MRTFHKTIGAILAIQIVAWAVTGLLFNYKYRYEEAYEPLASAPAPAPPRTPWVSPSDAMQQAALAPETLRDARLLHDSRGYLYLLETGSAEAPVAHLADARDGAPVSPLDATGAQAVFTSAIAASKHASNYGAVTGSKPAEAVSALLGRSCPGWELTLATGQKVTVNAVTAEITHTSLLNDTIDWTYRVHYMQYTPWKPVNIFLVLAFLALLLTLVASGVRMLINIRPRSMFGGRSSRRGPRIRF